MNSMSSSDADAPNMCSDAKGSSHLDANKRLSSSDELALAATQMAALALSAEQKGAQACSTVIDHAASGIGIDRSIVATWMAGGSVTATGAGTRITTNESVQPGTMPIAPEAMLVLPCRLELQGVQRDQSKERRTLLYARTDLDADVSETVQMHVLEAEIEDILAVTPSDCTVPFASYMYAIEVASQDDYNRPGVDTLRTQKGPTKVLVSSRTFVYARINQDSDCTEAAQVLALEREVKLIVESDVAASQFSPPYMYAIEIAAQDDYNRPGVDTLLALVVTRKIDRIVVWRADRLFSPDAFALFTRLCNQNNVSIVSVARN